MSEVLARQADGTESCWTPANRPTSQPVICAGSVNVGLGGRFAVGRAMCCGPTRTSCWSSTGPRARGKVRLGRIGFDNVRGHLAQPLQTLLDNLNSFNAARG